MGLDAVADGGRLGRGGSDEGRLLPRGSKLVPSQQQRRGGHDTGSGAGGSWSLLCVFEHADVGALAF